MTQDPHISVAASSNSLVRQALSSHPRVGDVEIGSDLGIRFSQGSWEREVVVGKFDLEVYGLVEFMDNNPMVCADAVSVPSAGATLALIALAPLAHAGLIADSPVVVLNCDQGEDEMTASLSRVGWDGGLTVHHEELDLGSVLAATIMVSILTPEDLSDIDALYEEQFGRSFYVRRDESSEWDPSLVLGQPFALYRLRISPDEPVSLLTIRVLADREGKCGAGQLIHAMNVMCGFEETLGVS